MDLISPDLYLYVYLIIVSIFTFCNINAISINRNKSITINNVDSDNRSALGICLLLIFFIGFRPVDKIFVDMVTYDQYYQLAAGEKFIFNDAYENVIFDNLMYYMAHIFPTSHCFFFLISIIYYGGMLFACKKLFPGKCLIPFLMLAAAFSTFNYATNGIKAGAAASIFLVAIAYRDKKLVSYPLIFISLGFHHAMFPVLVAYFLSTFFRKTKFYFYVWFACAFLSVMHVTYFQTLFGQFSDEKGQSYLIADGYSGYMTGFRLDFISYSIVPVIVGYIVVVKKKVQNEVYEFLLRNYLTMNSVWLLCMYASFTARIAYLSWFMYPIVLIYPFIYVDNSLRTTKNARKVVLYHLSFTLFMEFIFYNLIK